ncbi:hypothetical protein [Asticcacaulis sp. AC402]|uniref:hypothetical protein n=1 Tax=Asticcacaulis sp. AC402 TaxID=1282361 RepID=UPI0003F73A8D|nr:hypothetical protein [Asticcacaulis sp. AC402]
MSRAMILSALLTLGVSALPLMSASAQTVVKPPVLLKPIPKPPIVTTVRKAKLAYIMGVDTSDATCGTYDPAGLTNPVIYRTDSGAGRHLDIFAGDTGLVLIGSNLDLVQRVVVNFDSAPDVTAAVVSRRNGNTACGEKATDKVMTIRFTSPVSTSTQKLFGGLELYAFNESFLRNPPRIIKPNDPCLPENFNLEAGIPPQCALDFVPLAEVHGFAIRPLPQIQSRTALDNTGRVPTIERRPEVVGNNLGQFTQIALNFGNLSAVTGTARMLSPTIEAGRFSGTVRWENITAAGTWFFSLQPSLSLYRQPRTGTATVFSNSLTRREVNDTVWASETDFRRRFMGSNIASASFNYQATATPTPPPPPPAAANITAFDPGNRLYVTSGGTTTVGNLPGENSQILSTLQSEAWCAALPQPAPGPNGVRTVALGQTTLGNLNWGIRNSGNAAFTGTVTAELRLGGTVVDTMSFTGTLAAGATQIDTFQRPTQTVAIARESLGPLCFHVGLGSDAVVENRGYTVRITSPGSNSTNLRSIP